MECCYWESIVLARKGFLVAAAVLFARNKFGHQIFAGIWVILISLLLHIRFQPFADAVLVRASAAVSYGSPLCSHTRGVIASHLHCLH